MATVTCTVPDDTLADVTAAFTASYPTQWAAALADGQSPADFMQTMVAKYVHDVWSGYQAQEAAAAAQAASIAATNAVVFT